MVAFKLFVIVSGLALVVPDKGPNATGVTAIVVDAEGKPDAQDNPSSMHHTLLTFRAGARPPAEITEPFSIRVTRTCKTAASCKPNTTLAHGNQPSVVDLSGISGNSVRAECLDPKSLAKCVDGKKRPLAKGHVRLEGKWHGRAATSCSADFVPDLKLEAIDWDYRRWDAKKGSWIADSGRPPQAIGNSYVFETTVDLTDGDGIQFEVNGVAIPLVAADAASCVALGAASGDCSIVELQNEAPHAVATTAAQQRPDDRHFAVLYDLLAKGTKGRWVPYATDTFCLSAPADAPGKLEAPGSRCGGGGG